MGLRTLASKPARFLLTVRRDHDYGGTSSTDQRGVLMKKRIALLTTGLALAASGVASAAITPAPNPGHPATNPAGNCPTGQNSGATNGALQKCK